MQRRRNPQSIVFQCDYPDNSVHGPWWYLLVLREVVNECFYGERAAMQYRLELDASMPHVIRYLHRQRNYIRHCEYVIGA